MAGPCLKLFIIFFTHGFRGYINNAIYDTEGARRGHYGCTQGLLWVHTRVIMGSSEWADIGLESHAVPAQVTKHFVTFSSWERNGSVVKCLAQDRGAAGLSLTGVTASCP